MTIAKLYENHKRGKVSKQSFLIEARKDNNLPWVNNLTSYEDAVKILKNKGLISEANLNAPGAVGSSNQRIQYDSYSSNAEMNEDDYNDEFTNKRVEYKGRTATVIGAGEGMLDLQFDDAKKTVKLNVPEADVKIIESLNEAHDLTIAQIIDRLNPYQFKRGVDYEMSKLEVIDNITYEKVKEKVAKKMAEDPLAYRYTQLANAKQIEKDDIKLAMKPVKGDNFVDKDNEMKKVKGFNDEKENTTTSKAENRKGKPEGVKEMTGSKKKTAGVKDVMKYESKETVINEMIEFFKKKDKLKENTGTSGGMTPQGRSDLFPGSECITPNGLGIVKTRRGSIVSVQLEDGSEKDFTLNVLDAAKEKQIQNQADKDKAERDQMWKDWDKRGEKTFGGVLNYGPKKLDYASLIEKLKKVVNKIKLKKEGEALKDKLGNVTYASDSEAASIVKNAAAKGIRLTRQKV